MRVAILAFLLASATGSWSTPKEEPADKKAASIVQQLKGLGADTVGKRAVVGGVAGFLGGAAIRKTQDTILTCGILGGVAVAGACYVGWIKPEDVEKAAEKAAETVGVGSLVGNLFSSVEEKVESIKTSKISVSKIYKAAPGLVAGSTLGFALGYRLG